MRKKIVNEFKHVRKIMTNVKLKSPVSTNNRKYLDCPAHCGSELIGESHKAKQSTIRRREHKRELYMTCTIAMVTLTVLFF